MTNNVFLVLFFPPPPHAGPLPVVPVVQVSTARSSLLVLTGRKQQQLCVTSDCSTATQRPSVFLVCEWEA